MAEKHGSKHMNQHLLFEDDMRIRLGSAGDATLSYDGTDVVLNPKLVGSGRLRVEGALLVQKHEFAHTPDIIQNDGTAASGVDTEVNMHTFNDGLVLYVQNIGTQTILQPAVNANGLDYGYDQTNNEGVQWVMRENGSKGIQNKDYFTIGTSPAFFASLKFSIADVSGTDDCAFGFRKDAAFQAAIDDYTDMAALNVISGDIKIETILNNSATTTTDTTDNWADAASKTLRVNVSAAGVVTYQIDGSAPTTTAAFTFDDTDVVTPFFYMIHASDLAGAVVLQELEVGLQ